MLALRSMDAPRIVGVRHHSPACARLVRRRIRALRPAVVLIEGPADMNARLDELALPHRLPIAIFSYLHEDGRALSAWSPYCELSPEHVALREGRAAGAEVRLIDLPAWAVPARVTNRHGDRGRDRLAYVRRVCERLGMDGLDALWDHLFEQPLSDDALEARLETWFAALRESEGGPVAPGDAEREAFMAQHVAAAMAEGDGPVLVVCGGYHAPWLAEAWRRAPPTEPAVPAPPAGARAGSYLVPYDHARLDAFTGVDAGLPSPGWYRAVHLKGPERAAEETLEAVAKRLRALGAPVSTADLVAAEATTRGLMRLRGHAAPTRHDLLDGLAAAILDDVQETPLPWTERGPRRPGTDPRVDAMLAAMRGDRVGALAEGTPRPPLVADVAETLARLDLAPGPEPRTVRLDPTDARDRERSRTLHRLRVLGVPGFARRRGPERPTDAALDEAWAIEASAEREARLVEAAAFGATLASAAAARLERWIGGARDVGTLARLIADALFLGLDASADGALAEVAARAQREPRLARLGDALPFLLALYRHDAVFGGAGASGIGAAIEAMVRHGQWLFEGATGSRAADGDELRALIAIRDAAKHGEGLAVDRDALFGVMRRRAADDRAPPAHRGAAMGMLWSLGALDAPPARGGQPAQSEPPACGERPAPGEQPARGAAEDRERGSTSGDRALAGRPAAADARARTDAWASDVARRLEPRRLGDLLAGLFALAREEVVSDRALVAAIDRAVAAQAEDEFLAALPSLRLAFAWFPPRERDAIARIVLALHGAGEVPGSLRRLAVDAATVARGRALERRVDALMARYGLDGGAAARSSRGAPAIARSRERVGVSEEPTPTLPSRETPRRPFAHGAAATAPSAPPDDRPADGRGDVRARRVLERWRLVLGDAATDALGTPEAVAARDAALAFLYDREAGPSGRGVRTPERRATGERSRPTVPEWLDAIHTLFPRETVERLERDALERYGLHEIVARPDVLERVEPDPVLLRAVLRTKHRMDPATLASARRLVARVVAQLLAGLRRDVKAALSAPLDRRRTASRRSARDLDLRRTLARNLRHYDPTRRQVILERPVFSARTRRHAERWQLVLLVDQSASMLGSAVHAAVTAASLHGVRGLKTRLVTFDTSVVDLTRHVADPVELLMKVQLGGGTDIARAVRYAAGLVESPRRTVVALITDFFEGGDPDALVRRVRALTEQGVTVLGLAALDDGAHPAYDRELARRLAGAGAHVGAMTPGQLAAFVVERLA